MLDIKTELCNLKVPSDVSIDKVLSTLEFFKNGGVIKWKGRFVRIGECKDGSFMLLYKMFDDNDEDEKWRNMMDISFGQFVNFCKDVSN